MTPDLRGLRRARNVQIYWTTVNGMMKKEKKKCVLTAGEHIISYVVNNECINQGVFFFCDGLPSPTSHGRVLPRTSAVLVLAPALLGAKSTQITRTPSRQITPAEQNKYSPR